ncbi:MAG: NADH-quinone oxidoreductase subunit C [Ornithinimicrobium sp.]|uniref:NADH-quinone oxidoreductase subunit C n=1 Tax=Ornithinimicrobium sp. TaxID=1977084 RepID=UPI0026E0888A|nr:NADH-quinone oxidoreductase subunit C [Ornithinimicrobium sp.]MDO5741157.1 NADH-quinone oxidoreductase subunit C [Ornithinimicrobium sp.]
MSEVDVQERRVEPGGWHDAVRALKEDGYSFFDWLSAVDETDAEPTTSDPATSEPGPGFEVVCHLIDTHLPLRRVLLHTRVEDGAALASVTDLFAGAGWHERETHEMFGIGFEGFDDGTGMGLRPLLLPEGFEGTPLRKSFQLASRASKPWPGAKEPGGDQAGPAKRAPRRRLLPPGVPDESWGPRGDEADSSPGGGG